jgi:lipopolysaccharide/colanic/teichoic acid biosynthesis glycosyltransferase
LLFALPFLVILYIIGLFDTGSPIFTQERVGLNKKPFNLIKFLTMTVGTASVASHLVSSASITKFGDFYEKPSLMNYHSCGMY